MYSSVNNEPTRIIIQDDLFNFIQSKAKDNPICRVILDELQLCEDRERGNDLKHFNSEINYLGFSIESPHLISYITTDRIERINEQGGDVWDKSSRYHCKAGKVIRKLFTNHGISQFKEKDVEQFSNLFKCFSDTATGKHTFKLVEGDEIRKYYLEDTYSTIYGQKGTLWGSCMRYSECQGYFGLYTKNVGIYNPENERANFLKTKGPTFRPWFG